LLPKKTFAFCIVSYKVHMKPSNRENRPSIGVEWPNTVYLLCLCANSTFPSRAHKFAVIILGFSNKLATVVVVSRLEHLRLTFSWSFGLLFCIVSYKVLMKPSSTSSNFMKGWSLRIPYYIGINIRETKCNRFDIPNISASGWNIIDPCCICILN